MEKAIRSWSLSELADLLNGELVGPPDLIITGPAPAGLGDSSCLTFADEPKFVAFAETSDVGAILVRPGVSSTKPHIRVKTPKAAFGTFMRHCVRPLPLDPGIHRTAVIDPTAEIDPTARIGAYVVVERNAHIGPGSQIYPFCFVGEACRLDADCVLFPHVVLYQDVVLGQRVVIHAGTILGCDGFGYAWDGTAHHKIPHLGNIVIGDDCEIGSLTAVDRANFSATRLGAGTKVDNLVQIAHNVEIGTNVVIASQSGISGSCRIGERVILAGQSGVGDHVEIGDDVVMAGRSGTTVDILEAGIYQGFPAKPLIARQRQQAIMDRLPELNRKIKDLERRIAELEKQ